MKAYFFDIVDEIKTNAGSGERFTVWFSAEELDFARFNHGLIRQAGTVLQCYVEINLIVSQKHASLTLGLSQDLNRDKQTIASGMAKLRGQIAHSHDDPFLMIHEGCSSTESASEHHLPEKTDIVGEVLKLSKGLDLVGCYVGGPIYKGFANSYGQCNWFEKSSFVIDTSIYHKGDQAVKQSYADTTFDPDNLAQRLLEAQRGLELFQREPIAISPGTYRVFFAPAAVYEILSMINWGGFSRKALEVKNSPLLPLFSGHRKFSSAFSLTENVGQGVGPNFQSQGFLKSATLPIIEHGELVNTLISPKTAREYGLEHNGSDDAEAMCAIDMKAGNLPDSDILGALGDGLYINNLWYLNFSDRHNGCLTGMTRFLCFLVENGKPKAPFSVMRFDDSIYRIFGDNLLNVTRNRHMLIDTSTYEERATSCAILPGIIAENVRFTL